MISGIDPDTGRLEAIDADAHQPGSDVSFDYDPIGARRNKVNNVVIAFRRRWWGATSAAGPC